MKEKKNDFILNYPKKSFLEWNYADYKAYKELVSIDNKQY
jgi:hypothetical protein